MPAMRLQDTQWALRRMSCFGLGNKNDPGDLFCVGVTPNAEVTGRPLADGPVDRRVVRQKVLRRKNE